MKRSINFNGLTAGGYARAWRRAFAADNLAATMQAVSMQSAEIWTTLEHLLTRPQQMRRWRVYYRDGEYVRLLGDPLLGTVEAATLEEAERKGASLLPFGIAGAWVVEDDAPAGRFADGQQNSGTNER